ncbi:MAG: PBS lyase [Deltaproteobacteria bacterium]|nr:PBS lyase [Deltaproteobacteria bacterium]MBW2118119.1 PBS lyase [Deltaproteobacteria bacterium]MBW2344270.1 PBS lyase [Deltaproteobacteria bacterium]
MLESKFIGKTLTMPPSCPFCGLLIEKPRELESRRPGEMPVGSCSCGAVYACDETGHNQGAAMIEALVFGCDMDWDLAWNLLPEEDYKQEIVEDYDYIRHLIVPGGFIDSRRISGVLFFFRLHEDVQEVTSEGVRKRLKKARPSPVSPERPDSRTGKKSLSKKEIEELVGKFRIEPILSVAGEDKRLIKNLQRLIYSGDDLFRKRAAEILGRACAVIGEKDPGAVSKLLQGLFYAISDTAAFTWGAFEAIGEIISHRPDLFAGYVPQLYQFLADETRRAQVLQTIGRVAMSRPDLLRKHTFHFFTYLEDSDPAVRGYTALLMGNLDAHEAKEDLEKLLDEFHEIDIYENGNLEKMTVGQVAKEALKKISD